MNTNENRIDVSVKSSTTKISHAQQQAENLETEIAELKAVINKLTEQKDADRNYISHLEYKFHQFKSLKTVRLFGPIIQLERMIGSVSHYCNLFFKLAKKQESIGAAWVACREQYGKSGIKGVKYLLKKQDTIHDNSLPNLSELPFNITDGVVILSTKHTDFVAKLFAQTFAKLDISYQIIYAQPKTGYEHKWHIVICPQMFEKLPAHYLAFQMEQSVSSRWFTDEYFSRLKKAKFVFDYSLENIRFLSSEIAFKQLYYLPIDILDYPQPPIAAQNYQYDIVFYGDPKHCERRQIFLQELQKKFSVKIIYEVFGDELYDLLQQAKIIVNIHYYENALLETTRIYECLSLGKVIVSEKGSDQSEHKNLENLVEFVDIGDIEGMLSKIEHLLRDQEAFNIQLEKIQHEKNRLTRFQFYLYRFLLAQDLLSFDKFYEEVGQFIQPQDDFWCLTLPESVGRTEDFDKDNHYNIWKFPGLRHETGWIGCGLSYKFMLKRAADLQLPQVTICEDDVEFKAGFIERYADIKQALLNQPNEWDVFSGLVSDLAKDTRISGSNIQSDTETFYSINKLVSTVCNIYNQSSYPKIYQWNNNKRSTDNTIDRYIEQHGGIHGVIVSPFLVGHKEELFSTLWGQQNTAYNSMIANSQSLLNEKIKELAPTHHPGEE